MTLCNPNVVQKIALIMTTALFATAAMEILTPLLTKGGEKAVEIISEKLVEKATEKGIWNTFKSWFIVEEEQLKLQSIENKPIASNSDLIFLREKFNSALEKEPSRVSTLQIYIPLTGVRLTQAEILHTQIQEAALKLKRYYKRRDNAGDEVEGSYQNLIERTEERMLEYETKLKQLITDALNS